MKYVLLNIKQFEIQLLTTKISKYTPELIRIYKLLYWQYIHDTKIIFNIILGRYIGILLLLLLCLLND